MILFKNSKDRTYYYKINIYPTLFGDFLIQKEHGASQNKKPTNIIKEYATSKKEAMLLLLDIVISKKNIGYIKAA